MYACIESMFLYRYLVSYIIYLYTYIYVHTTAGTHIIHYNIEWFTVEGVLVLSIELCTNVFVDSKVFTSRISTEGGPQNGYYFIGHVNGYGLL